MNLLLGDCLDVLKTLPDSSVDSIVTDPPYGLAFMNKHWDYDVPRVELWRECLRVLKPGGHALIACGTRTQHRMAVNIEDAGFEIKDVISWIFGSGFPKSLNVAKSAAKQGLACECKDRSSDSLCELPNASLSVGLQTKETDSANMFASLQRPNPGEEAGPIQCQQPGEKVPKEGIATSKESRMEGRSHLQTNQGELHRAEVCSMSQGISSDGTQGRLRHGTSLSDGNSVGPDASASGSGASQGPQHEEQLHNEPGVISRQSRPQTCGSCGKTVFDPGLGTALKPACEFWTLARKPLGEDTVAANVQKWGTGAVNVDGCRVEFQSDADAASTVPFAEQHTGAGNGKTMGKMGRTKYEIPSGRFPANLILDEEAGALLDEQTGELKSGANPLRRGSPKFRNSYGEFRGQAECKAARGAESGGASRFFYCAKASKSERGEGNGHPTVKPIALMSYLCRLITPPKGIVLDPFMGSGSTGVAAKREGFDFIGIEREKEYLDICEKRIGSVML